MNVQVLQENFVKALTVAVRFSSSKAQLPILSNLHLLAKANKLIISATNLETSICLPLGAKVTKEGEIAVPAKTLYDLISNLNPGQLELVAEKEQLKISSANFSSQVLGVNATDFPDVPKKIAKADFSIEGSVINEALEKTLFAVSTDETRPILTGVLFVFEKSGLLMVGTDGFRLSYKKTDFKIGGEVKQFVLPRNILLEVSKVSETDEPIAVQFDETNNQVLFGTGGGVLSSRILEGKFPNYESIIPKSSAILVNVNREDFLKAIKLGAVFARDSANALKLTLEKGFVKVSAESSKSGTQEGRVEAKVEGGTLEIVYNYRFLEEFLQSVEGESVEIAFNDNASPGVFKDPQDPSYFHLIMPVKS
jgi:DNA polymerase III subunit beta